MQESAYEHHFGPDNIPFGIASSEAHPLPQAVTRVGNNVIYLSDLLNLQQRYRRYLQQPTLNAFAALGRDDHRAVRRAVQDAIKLNQVPSSAQEHVDAVDMHLPVAVGDYTDFSCSLTHNRNAGAALMGMSGRLPPGYNYMPLGYAGRCSSIVVSGTEVQRPRGMFFEHGLEGLQGGRNNVLHGPSRMLDFELEMAVVIGSPLRRGDYLRNPAEAEKHIFGYILLNDWSARDFQQLEMIPVGPFQSKHSATSISAWIITPDAVRPFLTPARDVDRPLLAPHLRESAPLSLDIDVTASVITDGKENVVTRTNVKEMDWTFEQLIAHQTSAGSGLNAGDLLAIGTISGPGQGEQGCLLEGHVPGETSGRDYIRDHERVRLTGYCGAGVGFGHCTAEIVPALDSSVWPSADVETG